MWAVYPKYQRVLDEGSPATANDKRFALEMG